jgi:phosphoserine phosphatase
MSDVKLLEMVGHPVVVNPDPRLRKRAEERGWPIEDWGAAPEKQANLSKKKGMRFF